MKLQDLVGVACIVKRPDSDGYEKHARVDRVDPAAPFPVHASGSWGGAWFLPIELEPSRLAL
jgi:hypothetical protein